ncbi:MAG: hypothetical protein AABW67_06470 [Nanoarchaeota archaeon]
MYYKDLQKAIEEQEIVAGDIISVLLKNSAYNNKDSNIPQLSRIEAIFERLDTKYFVYLTQDKSKTKVYKVLNKVRGIEKITCQTKSQ